MHAQMLLFLSKNNKKNLLHINQYPQKLVEYKVNKFIEFHKYTIENSNKTNKLIWIMKIRKTLNYKKKNI